MNFFIPVAIIAVLVTLAGCADRKNDTAAVKAVEEAWGEFKKANLNGEGEIASEWVTSGTHKYFEELVETALNGTRAELAESPAAEQALVLLTRASVSPSELRTMSGKAFFIHAVNNGWARHKDREITRIQVARDRASALVMRDGQASMLELHFTRAPGGWRIDFRSLISLLNLPFEAVAQYSGRTERELVTEFVEKAIGRELSASDWEPLNTEPQR